MKATIAAAVIVGVSFVPAHANPHQLWLLPHNTLRLDRGAVFDRDQLPLALHTLMPNGDCPPLHIHVRRSARYDAIASVLAELSKLGCRNIGFVGEEE